MARSTFYYNLKQSKKEDKYINLKYMISSIFHQHKGRYGYRRITLELCNRGITVNHKTVRKLMVVLGIKSKIKRMRYRSYKGEVGKVCPNIINRDFKADRPYVKLATDITQVTIDSQKIYFSPILDMFNGEILAHAISSSPNLELIKDMLNQLYTQVDIPAEAILHSDQGWHYQHKIYQNILQEHKTMQSMSRKGNCLDNSKMENFFGIMKSELLYPNKYTSMDVFIKDLNEYIEYYNNERIKLGLNGKSPVQYRKSYQAPKNV